MDDALTSPGTLALLVANLGASILAFNNTPFYEANVLHVGPMLRKQEWYRALASGFLHINVIHLALNMLVLFQFGSILEQTIGTGAYLLLYFAALIGGSLWAVMDNLRKPDYRAAGASGALSGVLAGYCIFYPLDTIYFLGILPVPALVFLIVFMAGSAYLSTRANTVIGHEAHFGGAITGVVMVLLIAPGAWTQFIEALGSMVG